jgi:CelD/BcsL family acetyltransferase involved in cellulose biosynthesis
MDLSAGFDPFLARLRQGYSRLGGISRKQGKLAREVGELRFVFDSRDHQLLRTVITWKSAQYLRTGWADRFARPGMIQHVEQLSIRGPRGSRGILSMLYTGDEPVAGHFGLRSDRVMAHWFPAYDTRFGSYSPGLAEAEAAPAIQHIDLGTGAEGYKQWFRSRDLVVAQGRVIRGSPGAALHWVRRAPVKRIQRAVEQNPSLYRAAKRVRASYARIDSALRRRAGTEATLGDV